MNLWITLTPEAFRALYAFKRFPTENFASEDARKNADGTFSILLSQNTLAALETASLADETPSDTILRLAGGKQ